MKKLLTYLFLALSLVTLAALWKKWRLNFTSSTNNHQSKGSRSSDFDFMKAEGK